MPQVKRWYKGYKYKGNPKELVEQISKKVQGYNLSQYVPILRLEKGAKARNPFYFFLAIESEEVGQIPSEVSDSNLLKLPLFKIPAAPGSPCFTYEQIKSMVGVAHDIHDYTNPIPYQTLQKVTNDNPFDWLASPLINKPSSNVDELSQRYDQLLYWLSALGSGTWESFKKACDALGLEEPKRILRRFSSLKLATVLPELTTWKQGLRRLQGIVPSLYEWKRFDGNDFVECNFCGFCSITGMYQMFPTEESDRPCLTLFYDSETDTWQQGDWYGLRFLALYYGNHQCIAHDNPTAARLAIPFSQRWPELYERALVLASGRLPSYQRTEQSLWLIYENVGLELVEQLTTKLYVTCEEDSTHARSIRCLSTT